MAAICVANIWRHNGILSVVYKITFMTLIDTEVGLLLRLVTSIFQHVWPAFKWQQIFDVDDIVDPSL